MTRGIDGALVALDVLTGRGGCADHPPPAAPHPTTAAKSTATATATATSTSTSTSASASPSTAATADSRASTLPTWPRTPTPAPAVVGRRRPEDMLIWADLAALLAVTLLVMTDPTMRLVTTVGTLVGYAAFGLYRARLTLSVLDDLPTLAAGAGTAVLLAAACTGNEIPGPRCPHVLGMCLAAAAATTAGRTIGYPLVRLVRRRLTAAPTLIIGTAQIGRELGQLLLAHPGYGLRLVGYLDDVPSVPRGELPAPLLGGSRDLADVVAACRVRRILVAFGSVRPAELVELLRACDRLRCQIMFVPRLYELHQGGRGTEHIRGIPLIRLRPEAVGRPTWRVKRALDLATAGLALLFAAPVLALCALAVRLEGGPGVLFRQERVSLGGRRFQMMKFRSLRPTSEWESETQWTVTGDPRIGPVGRIIRTTSLDELPQLLNVLRGEMSLVGPRPERPFFVEQFSQRYPCYEARHRVPAGLTGWAAVNGLRGNTSIIDRVRFDNSYIENWSLWLDIKIMVRTLGSVLTRTGG